MAQHELERREYDADKYLFREGDAADCAFVIEEGAVCIYKRGNNNKDKLLATLKRGDILGEMALVDNAPRGASAIATEFTKVTVISRALFEERLGRSNPVIGILMNALVKRIRAANEDNVNAPASGWQPVQR